MIVSYNWLQTFFDTKLPEPEKLAELLTFHTFEVEGIENLEHDVAIEIDVLPNRSSDCLCHRGIAREIATILELPLKDDPLKEEPTLEPVSNVFQAEVDDPTLCRRFSAAVIEGVKVGPSPEWLSQALETIGQKSINNIVDATNYVMFNLGQPLHAFDRDKMKAKNGSYHIHVRNAGQNEKITTLTGETHELDSHVLVIADGHSNKPLGIAGIKGGQEAEIDSTSTNLVIEAANFNPTHTRKASQFLKLRTDASARFENEPVMSLRKYALRDVVALITQIAGGELEGYFDWSGKKFAIPKVPVTCVAANRLLGTKITETDLENLLKRLGFAYEKQNDTYTITPPFERTDITIKQDVIEEIGRVYGYEKIEAHPLPEWTGDTVVNKRFYYTEVIRAELATLGFSEVYTNTFQTKGKVQMVNAVAQDKSYLRHNLRRGFSEALEQGVYNADLIGEDQIKIFEFGTVFSKDSEYISFALAVRNAKKSKHTEHAILEAAVDAIENGLGTKLDAEIEQGIIEINFSELLEKLSEPKKYEQFPHKAASAEYKTLSQFPFVLRDLAVWTINAQAEEVVDIVKTQAGDLLVNHRLFDVFEKDDKTSYAFHLVFQAQDRTLTDNEIGPIMDRVEDTINRKKDWQVR